MSKSHHSMASMVSGASFMKNYKHVNNIRPPSGIEGTHTHE